MNEVVEATEFQVSSVDCFEENNTLWFRLSDIAKVLEVGKDTASRWKEWADEDEIELKKNQLGGHDIPYGSESLLYRILNRSNSPKAKPFERWVTKEVIPTIRKTGSYSLPRISKEELDVIADQNKVSKANIYLALSQKYGNNKTYSQVLDAYATKALEGEFVLPLPPLEQKNYSATEVGNMLGISANRVGKIANALGIKVDGEYGKWYVDKSPYSNKEVNTFRYSDAAVRRIQKETK